MPTRVRLYAGSGVVLFATLALAACGGGGGGASTTPVAYPTVAPPASLTFAGTKNIQATYGYPAASPYPNENLTSSLTDTTTAYTDVFPNTNEFYTTQTETLPTVTHTYKLYTGETTAAGSASGVTNVEIVSNSTTDDSHDSQVIAYTSPLVVDEQPETAGASWTNTAALTASETYADGSSDQRKQNADGSYTDEFKSPDGTDATLAVNADGSASLSTPANAPGIENGCIVSYNFGAPRGGTFTITIDYNPAMVQLCTGQTNTTFTETATAWFNPISASNPLYSDTTAVKPLSAFPASCKVAASVKPGNDINRTVNSIDPLLGYAEQTITDTYTASGSGAQCVVMSDDVLAFYDWQGSNTGGTHNFLTGSPLQETLTTQTLTLQSGTNGTIGAQSVASLSPAAIAAAQANFGSRVTLSRQKQLKSLMRSLRAHNAIKTISHTARVPLSFASLPFHGGRK